MCSSRVDPSLALNALLWGADGVLIAGCHPGDCHYKEGNYYTRRRYAQLKTVLQSLDIAPARIELAWISASEGPRYRDVVNTFTQKIRDLGPNPLKKTSW
jgi:F420-non-reducing hydrogenase iron-sulfur subunit